VCVYDKQHAKNNEQELSKCQAQEENRVLTHLEYLENSWNFVNPENSWIFILDLKFLAQ